MCHDKLPVIQTLRFWFLYNCRSLKLLHLNTVRIYKCAGVVSFNPCPQRGTWKINKVNCAHFPKSPAFGDVNSGLLKVVQQLTYNLLSVFSYIRYLARDYVNLTTRTKYMKMKLYFCLSLQFVLYELKNTTGQNVDSGFPDKQQWPWAGNPAILVGNPILGLF